MDRTALAAELRAARFRTTQFRAGYDEAAVDDLVDELARQLGTGVADREVIATAEGSRFPTTKARRGYEMADVDALLERVVTSLGGTVTPGHSRSSATDPSAAAPTSSSAPAALPSAIIEPPRGFLARLLGR